MATDSVLTQHLCHFAGLSVAAVGLDDPPADE